MCIRDSYDIEQNPTVPGDKNPDYRIEGQIFDNYAPSSGNARNIATNISDDKVTSGQATGSCSIWSTALSTWTRCAPSYATGRSRTSKRSS